MTTPPIFGGVFFCSEGRLGKRKSGASGLSTRPPPAGLRTRWLTGTACWQGRLPRAPLTNLSLLQYFLFLPASSSLFPQRETRTRSAFSHTSAGNWNGTSSTCQRFSACTAHLSRPAVQPGRPESKLILPAQAVPDFPSPERNPQEAEDCPALHSGNGSRMTAVRAPPSLPFSQIADDRKGGPPFGRPPLNAGSDCG